MRNKEQWVSGILKFDSAKNVFFPDLKKIYPGSMHIAEIQSRAYIPLFKEHCKGKILDCGCGSVPYYELLMQQVSTHYCVDWSLNPKVEVLLDEKVDLNTNFVLKESAFDAVLISDVIAHIQNPQLLIQVLSAHLKHDGKLIITTPFVYWISEYPHEYFHPTEFALRKMCEESGMEILHLEPYGGYADVLLDTMNKGMTSRFSNRVFRLLASVVKKSFWYKKSNEKTKYTYPIGYTLVAKKL